MPCRVQAAEAYSRRCNGKDVVKPSPIVWSHTYKYTPRKVSLAAERADAGFIKTFMGTKLDLLANVEHNVKILRSVLKPETTIKASGGCYTIEAIVAHYKAGAR